MSENATKVHESRFCWVVVPLDGEPRLQLKLDAQQAAKMRSMGWHDEFVTLARTARTHFDAGAFQSARRWAAAADALALACLSEQS